MLFLIHDMYVKKKKYSSVQFDNGHEPYENVTISENGYVAVKNIQF